MKNKTIIFLCAALLLILSGCGKKEEESNVTIEEISTSIENQEDSSQVEEISKEQISKEENLKEEMPEIEENLQNHEEVLEGDVRSIGEGSIVVSQIFLQKDDENNVNIAVSVPEGHEDEVLVTVNFSDDVRYELWTVKNGGINGDADVTKAEATFSDIEIGANLVFSGYYVMKDKEFMADYVIIYRFI